MFYRGSIPRWKLIQYICVPIQKFRTPIFINLLEHVFRIVSVSLTNPFVFRPKYTSNGKCKTVPGYAINFYLFCLYVFFLFINEISFCQRPIYFRRLASESLTAGPPNNIKLQRMPSDSVRSVRVRSLFAWFGCIDRTSNRLSWLEHLLHTTSFHLSLYYVTVL